MITWDRQKIEFLRGYCSNIGHTDGTPFESATVTLFSGRDYDLYSMKEIEDLIKHLDKVALSSSLQEPSPTDKFVYQLLKANGLIDGFSELNQRIFEGNLIRESDHSAFD